MTRNAASSPTGAVVPVSAPPATRPPVRRPRGLVGFTLIELLVVLSIIGLLISILTPSLSRAVHLARIAVCSSRMKNLYQACMCYAANFQGCTPHYDQWLWDGQRIGGDSGWWVEKGTLWPYMKSREAYFCPEDDHRRIQGGIAIGAGGIYGDRPIHSYVRIMEMRDYYAEHLMDTSGLSTVPPQADYIRPCDLTAGCFEPSELPNTLPGTTITRASIPLSPARTGFFYEEAQGTEPGLAQTAPSGAVLTVLLNDGYSYYTFANDMMTNRHLGRGNILFFDGHVMSADAARYNMYPFDPYPQAMATCGVEVPAP